MQLSYDAMYRALVTSVADPTNSGKIRVQCPQISGLAEIRAAEPANPADRLPNVGSTVWLVFNGGDLTKPVYFSNSSFVEVHPNGSVSLTSLATAADVDSLRALALSGDDGQPSGTFNTPTLLVTDENGTSAADISVSGSIYSSNLIGTPETWHTPSYNSGWAASTTFNSSANWAPVKFRRDAQDNVVIIGAFKCTSATPSLQVFSLGAGYSPSSQWPFFVARARSGVTSVLPATVTASGNVDIIASITGDTGNLNDEYLINVTIPLGNLP